VIPPYLLTPSKSISMPDNFGLMFEGGGKQEHMANFEIKN
jgi:hypothetical protein